MTLFAQFRHRQASFDAAMQITKFLAANQRIENFKNMTVSAVAKCKQMQVRGKKIACMNRIRMCILKQMWNDQKREMVHNLKEQKSKKKEALRIKRIAKLMRLGDEVRDEALKCYFHFCKERAAKAFIEWRVK